MKWVVALIAISNLTLGAGYLWHLSIYHRPPKKAAPTRRLMEPSYLYPKDFALVLNGPEIRGFLTEIAVSNGSYHEKAREFLERLEDCEAMAPNQPERVPAEASVYPRSSDT